MVIPVRIIIGAQKTKLDSFISTNVDTLNVLDRNSFKNHCKPNQVDVFLAEHVWEHLTFDDGVVAASNCREFLKCGGILRIAVPDGYHGSKRYIDKVKPGGFGAWSKDHKILFTYKTLSKLLYKAGFNIKLLEYWDEYHSFHHINWDASLGTIFRSLKFESPNPNRYSSLIIDAIK